MSAVVGSSSSTAQAHTVGADLLDRPQRPVLDPGAAVVAPSLHDVAQEQTLLVLPDRDHLVGEAAGVDERGLDRVD